MNIDKILQTGGLDAGRNEATQATRNTRTDGPARCDADAANTSKFGNLIAKASDGLADGLAVRQEKVDAMRGFVDGNDEISDSQIDTIINRLLTN